MSSNGFIPYIFLMDIVIATASDKILTIIAVKSDYYKTQYLEREKNERFEFKAPSLGRQK